MLSGGHRWILVSTDYFTKWVEAIPTKQATNKVVIKFILENIITRFGVPARIIFDNGMAFRSKEFNTFYEEYGIKISHSSPYHPQRNGQAESSNKNIIKIIKRVLGQNKRAWDSKMNLSLWEDRITVKKSIGRSPHEPFYGKRSRLPLDNLLPIHRFISQEGIEIDDPLQERLMQLVELDEVGVEAQEQNIKIQNQMKRLYDKTTTNRKFEVGDLVLMWNARSQDKGKNGKFEAL
ncbi:uncharacterized protein LOC131875907 [Cryptomeria japonica]|uniref:uncharacterized protein LOC131875907 n=1 Tax=Cryptomeria japonica TaxID=3369 RepID=UPI0027DAB22B|nr:uncharacterized protein LOC131875907 [Cryptomeria japonica]